MPISRETTSSDSPRNSRMTISRLRVALQRWMTFGPAFSPGPVGSFGLFFGFSIGPSIWTIRCPTSSTADHQEHQPALTDDGVEAGEAVVADLGGHAVDAQVPGTGIVHADPARGFQPDPLDRGLLGME